MYLHQENMSVQCIPPYTPLLYSKTGVCRGIPIFLIFAPKHILWVLVCTHNLCFEQNKKNIKVFLLKMFILFTTLKTSVYEGRINYVYFFKTSFKKVTFFGLFRVPMMTLPRQPVSLVSMITLLSSSGSKCIFIRKTCPCNVYPLIPHFYIAKLGYAGVYQFFLFLLQNIYCGYSCVPTIYVLSKIRKISKFFF